MRGVISIFFFNNNKKPLLSGTQTGPGSRGTIKKSYSHIQTEGRIVLCFLFDIMYETTTPTTIFSYKTV